MSSKGASSWPDLVSVESRDTRQAILLWAQIVGKVRLALEPMVNHWWQVPLYVSTRGLTTSLMHSAGLGVELEFDFIDHLLQLRTTDGASREIALIDRSVADVYWSTFGALDEVGVHVEILARPVEVEDATPFAEDKRTREYEPESAHRFWLALVEAHRVMTIFRGRFIGKASPVHFFWGGSDLATTRFSGRPAPLHKGGIPNCADWVMELAYSHEVSSCGFWPAANPGGSFYCYAYPEPKGFPDWPVEPKSAYYDPAFGEFLLPYEAVRTADDPTEVLLGFLQTTYEAAAELGGWDRGSLESDFTIGGRRS
jgi:hypothetical protein